MRNRTTRLAMLIVASLLAIVVAACGSDNKKSSSSSTTNTGGAAAQPGKGKTIALGTKNFTEQFVLGELYRQALEAKGYTVNYKKNLGSTEIADKALKAGDINAYPEYIGIYLTTVAGDTKSYKTVDEAYAAAQTQAESKGETLTQKTAFSNVDAIGVTKDYATKNGLTAVPDLKKLGSKFKLAGPPEFKTRFTGIVGLKKVYGVTPTFVPLQIGLQYKALDDGKVQGADVFTTDGQLQGGKYTVLKDPQNIFGFQPVAMVTDKATADKLGADYQQTIDAVSAKLTTEAMQKMNGAVDLDKQDPAAVAKQFLQANGLLAQ